MNHEIAHALGFTVFNSRFDRNVTDGPGDNRTYNAGGVPTATLTPSNQGTHTDAGTHPNDLMNPTIGTGTRRLPSQLDKDILNHDVWAPGPAGEFIHPPEEYGLKWLTPFPYQRNVRYDFKNGALEDPQYYGSDDDQLNPSDFIEVVEGTLDWLDWDPAFPDRHGLIGIDNRDGAVPRTTVIRIHLDNWDRDYQKKDVWKEVEWVALGGATVTQRHSIVPPGYQIVEDYPDEQDLGNGWHHGDYWYKIVPNPPWEEIEITYTAPPGGIVMDEFIHIATECVSPWGMFGACCLSSSDARCMDGTQEEKCRGIHGYYQGDGTICSEVMCPVVPAVSEWGVVVMVLLVLTAATIVIRKRRAMAAS